MHSNDVILEPSAPLDARDVDVLHLRAGGTSVVVSMVSPPSIVHWGEDLGDADPTTLCGLALAAAPQRVSGGLDVTPVLSVLPTPAHGWLGTPGIEGHRDGNGASIRWAVSGVDATSDSARISLTDDAGRLAATLELRVGHGGLFHQRITLRNSGTSPYMVQRLTAAFPLPWDATEILDTTGRHLRERSPQRHDFTFGSYSRDSRRGRPGADATLLFCAGRPGFGFETGRVHGIHVAWSGNHTLLAERIVTGEAFLAGGELYGSGEITIEPGSALTTPWIIGSWGDGLNELSWRFHDELRARPQHPQRPRPVTLNTWEAVYFDHDLARLTDLADAASEVGIERFVLDDGWFRGRRDDTSGLGDWHVDETVWPEGLHPLVDHVRARGMEFGLWVEPEMVNPDSDIARQHPDWILRTRVELPPSARQQQVLNLAHPDAYAYIAARLHALLDEYPIAYLKWDHNRDLVDAGRGPGAGPLVHEHTLAAYCLFDELKAQHPGLEIESCASGGARVDLGILERTDRIWTSDCLDPLERLSIQRYTGLLLPPELMGAHITSETVHSTGRVTDLDLSASIALLGHFGIERDISVADADDRARIAAWVDYAKRIRPLVATGRVVHVDGTDDGIDVRGIVAADASQAVFTITQEATSVAYPAGRVRFPGLDPDRTYRVAIAAPVGVRPDAGQSELPWAQQGVALTGRQLAVAGIRPPVQYPGRATVVEVTTHN
ncbi:alpha-galactosidase [uncultured Microbacterium sp.]|uniref:alpha-galactosidase n=1 Tax=uncultured Microbacterium sp. TaxID=191216 RepID=UPI0028D2483E|nr:alpha-galactosidase [uncultured Microbacterium sp.]